MQIGIPRESLAGETRVAATPATVEQLKKLGFEVAIEAGAGQLASFDDAAFEAAGASVVPSVWQADLIFKVNAPTDAEIAQIKDGATLVSFIWPAQNPELVKKLSERNINVMAMDMVPRISRAQSLDALSSMANIGGYRAVVEAAHQFGRFFTGQITAAGKVPPAKVLVIGAGVAGLAAIGTAGSLGAIVRAFDTRLEVAEQIESMGGEFLKLDFGGEDGASSDGYAKVMSEEFIKAEMELFAQQAKEVDIIITTALIPGKPAPKLITAEMVKSMKPGSVIVDMAAEQGGNCELTVPGEAVVRHGVTIVGYTDLASRMARQSSTLYATNLFRLSEELCKTKDGVINVNMEDDAIRGLTVIKNGEITWPAPPLVAAPKPVAKPAAAPAAKKGHGHGEASGPMPAGKLAIVAGVTAVLFALVGAYAPAAFLSHFTVFVLACFVGYMVVWNVKPALHTPLMSVTNAISSIIAIGALVQISPMASAAGRPNTLIMALAALALVLTAINMFGGFAVTQRMLAMFRK